MFPQTHLAQQGLWYCIVEGNWPEPIVSPISGCYSPESLGWLWPGMPLKFIRGQEARDVVIPKFNIFHDDENPKASTFDN